MVCPSPRLCLALLCLATLALEAVATYVPLPHWVTHPEDESKDAKKLHTMPASKCNSAYWKDRLVVISRYDEDVSWVSTHLQGQVPALVMNTADDGTAAYTVPSDSGREAMAFLYFILEHYDCLPEVTAFVHAHRHSHHSPDIVVDLLRLKWDDLPTGFVPLSRTGHNTSLFLGDPDSHVEWANVNNAGYYDPETLKWSIFAYNMTMNMIYIWEEAFQEGLGPMPNTIVAPCCGQFAVAKDRILAHPPSFYAGLVEWLLEEHMPSFWSGLAFETVWHIMFGAGPIIGDIPECTIYTCDKGMTKLPSTLRNSRRMHVSLKPRGTRLCSKVNCHGWR